MVILKAVIFGSIELNLDPEETAFLVKTHLGNAKSQFSLLFCQ